MHFQPMKALLFQAVWRYLPRMNVLFNDHVRDNKVVIVYIGDMKIEKRGLGGNAYGN